MKSKARKLRDASEVDLALTRLRPLEGDPVVDAVVAALRWVLRDAEWRSAFGELEKKHGSARREGTATEARAR